MNSITEQHIEQYIRFPEELTQEEFSRIEAHLKENNEAQQLAEWLREFYEEFDVLHRPITFTLVNKNLKGSYSGPMVLAAMTSEKKKSGLVTKATFGSEEESTLVRVLEDTQTHQYQFHVLSKYLSIEDRVLIGFGDYGLELITEKGGKIKNVKEQSLSDINWEEALLLLRLPSSTCVYTPNGEPQEFSVCDECTLSINNGTCTFTTTDSEITRVLFEQSDKTTLYYLTENALTFSVDENIPFDLYIYK